jgi:hypothetical protein
MTWLASSVVWLGAGLMTGCATVPVPPTEQRIGWPGLPPDCWTEVRNFQGDGDDWNWSSRTKIERVVASKPDAATLSPNGAYYFALAGEQPDPALLIFAVKDHFSQISFTGSRGLTDVKWINERLLYLRVWWGRVAATDLVFDVENERMVLTESVHDGGNAMAQYRDMCPRLGGCRCMEKAAQ